VCFSSLHILRTVDEVRSFQKHHYLGKKTTGFVPTMGALHSGHLQLMKQAKAENELGLASIFVNPTQFSPGEDLDKYPRQVERDLELLNSVNMDAVFLPSESEIYPKNSLCHVEPKAFNSIYEGKKRPEFFRGVATVVCKLFNIILPTVSYFGQKDISQCVLIKQMIQDLNMDGFTAVKIIETIRDKDGLALSSRNAYLSEEERAHSSILYKALKAGKDLCEKEGGNVFIEKKKVEETIRKVLQSEPLVTNIEYISIASHKDMKELEKINSQETGAVLSSAIRIGKVRLIDNLLVGRSHTEILNG
jgi:pantoate--beta-alanine ligase